jgi:hypothetical protein
MAIATQKSIINGAIALGRTYDVIALAISLSKYSDRSTDN